MDKARWTGKSYGGYWGNWCFLQLLKLGALPAYGLLLFVAAYFVVFRRKACEGGVKFLSKVEGRKIGAISLETYRLAFSFGVCLLDRAMAFSGSKKIKIDDECEKTIKPILESGRGAVVVTAHVGGWEMAGAELLKYGRRVFMPGTDGEDPRIRKLSESARKTKKISVNVSGGALSNIEAYSVLKGGGIVAMHADRYAGGRFARVKFLGEEVAAPTAAYWLAKAAGVPVVQTVCFRGKLFHYSARAFPPMDANLKTPNECASEFMSNLESAIKAHKYQWFNFYDFWK